MAESVILIALVPLALLVLFDTLVLVGLVGIVHDRQTNRSVPLPDTTLRAGDQLPDFAGMDLDGRAVTKRSVIGHVRALLFVSSGCSSCSASLEELRALESKSRGSVLVVCQGTHGECANITSAFDLPWPVIADERGDIAQILGVAKYPMAILLDEGGRVRSVGEPKRSALESALDASGTALRPT